MIFSGHKVIFCHILYLSILFTPLSHASAFRTEIYKPNVYIEKDYYMILFGFFLFLPEIVELELSDNGTFSLSSDLFDQPVIGTYEKNILLLQGEGTTGIYYDIDFEEDTEIAYRFVGLPLGIRDFFMLGIGSREYRWETGSTLQETFIFFGPGF